MTIKFYSATWVSTMMLVCNADKLLGLLLGSSDKRGETDLATGEASLGLASLGRDPQEDGSAHTKPL